VNPGQREPAGDPVRGRHPPLRDGEAKPAGLSAVPVVKELSHLPVLVDPSHACGTWRWVPAMTEAALAVGAHGVMVEIHPEPAKALSDGPQALDFDVFRRLMQRLVR